MMTCNPGAAYYTHRFESVSALCSALWHEFEGEISEVGDFNVEYSKQTNVTIRGHEHSHCLGKQSISLWCDGKEREDGSEEDNCSKKRQKRDTQTQNKGSERDQELENMFQQLKKKHEDNYSGPQLRLWACMIIANTQDDMDNPPKVPMITGSVQRQPRREELTSAASAVSKHFLLLLCPLPSWQDVHQARPLTSG